MIFKFFSEYIEIKVLSLHVSLEKVTQIINPEMVVIYEMVN
jgi:hypothetical protein